MANNLFLKNSEASNAKLSAFIEGFDKRSEEFYEFVDCLTPQHIDIELPNEENGPEKEDEQETGNYFKEEDDDELGEEVESSDKAYKKFTLFQEYKENLYTSLDNFSASLHVYRNYIENDLYCEFPIPSRKVDRNYKEQDFEYHSFARTTRIEDLKNENDIENCLMLHNSIKVSDINTVGTLPQKEAYFKNFINIKNRTEPVDKLNEETESLSELVINSRKEKIPLGMANSLTQSHFLALKTDFSLVISTIAEVIKGAEAHDEQVDETNRYTDMDVYKKATQLKEYAKTLLEAFEESVDFTRTTKISFGRKK